MRQRLIPFKEKGRVLLISGIAIIILLTILANRTSFCAQMQGELLSHLPDGGFLYIDIVSLPKMIITTLEQPHMKILQEASGDENITELIDAALDEVLPGLSLDKLLLLFPGEFSCGAYYEEEDFQFIVAVDIVSGDEFSPLLKQFLALGEEKGGIKVKEKTKGDFLFYELKGDSNVVYLAFDDSVLLVSTTKEMVEGTMKNFAEARTPLDDNSALISARENLSDGAGYCLLCDGQKLGELILGKFPSEEEGSEVEEALLSGVTEWLNTFLQDLRCISLSFRFPPQEASAVDDLTPSEKVFLQLQPGSETVAQFGMWQGKDRPKWAPQVVPGETVMLSCTTGEETITPKSKNYLSYLLSFLPFPQSEAELMNEVIELLPTPPELAFLSDEDLTAGLGQETATAYMPGPEPLSYLFSLTDKAEANRFSLLLYSLKEPGDFEGNYLAHLNQSELVEVETVPYLGKNIHHLTPTESAYRINEETVTDWINKIMGEMGMGLLEGDEWDGSEEDFGWDMYAQISELFPIMESYVFFLSDFMVIAYDPNVAQKTIARYMEGDVLAQNPQFQRYLAHVDDDNYSLFYVSTFFPTEPYDLPDDEDLEQKTTMKEKKTKPIDDDGSETPFTEGYQFSYQHQPTELTEIWQMYSGEGFIISTTLGANSLKIEGYPKAFEKLFMSILLSAFFAVSEFDAFESAIEESEEYVNEDELPPTNPLHEQ